MAMLTLSCVWPHAAHYLPTHGRQLTLEQCFSHQSWFCIKTYYMYYQTSCLKQIKCEFITHFYVLKKALLGDITVGICKVLIDGYEHIYDRLKTYRRQLMTPNTSG